MTGKTRSRFASAITTLIDPRRSIPLAAGIVLAATSLAAQEHWPPAGVSYYGDARVPDISGLWLGSQMGIPGQGAQSNSGSTVDGRPPVFWTPWPLPYTPAYQKMSDDRVAAAKKGKAIGDISARCLPFGMPLMLTNKPYPDEIVQTPGRVTMFMYGTFPVVIWTDGRPHPANLQPSYNGHSIGHWVDDTLFIDTVGIKGVTPLDGARDPHSTALHLKWTIQRVAPDILHVDLTLYDSEAFTQPVSMTTIWQRQTDRRWEVLDDGSCFENNNEIGNSKALDGFAKF